MRIVFALYKYFPFGGLQRDMLAIARACVALQLQVEIVCSEWEGPQPDTISVTVLPAAGLSNHQRNEQFSRNLQQHLQQHPAALVVGFNRMAGLDVYYAADTCFKAKLHRERPFFLRWLPRYRAFLREEAAVFSDHSATKILALAQQSIDEYEAYYPGASKRCTLLPPGIARDRQAPPDAAQIRRAFRDEWHIHDDEMLVLMVGSGFRTKGVDRAITALASLPEDLRGRVKMMVVGQDNAAPFIKQAQSLGVAGNIEFLHGRNDIPRFLLGADLLVHPAYRENTGTVLLEAAAAGLPVLTTAVCGYSHYIREFHCGMVLNEPFHQYQLNRQLAWMLTDKEHIAAMRSNALAATVKADIYDMPQRAAAFIFQTATEKRHHA